MKELDWVKRILKRVKLAQKKLTVEETDILNWISENLLLCYILKVNHTSEADLKLSVE